MDENLKGLIKERKKTLYCNITRLLGDRDAPGKLEKTNDLVSSIIDLAKTRKQLQESKTVLKKSLDLLIGSNISQLPTHK